MQATKYPIFRLFLRPKYASLTISSLELPNSHVLKTPEIVYYDPKVCVAAEDDLLLVDLHKDQLAVPFILIFLS